MKTLVYQAQEKGCGFASVKMALIHASKNPNYACLPEPLVDEAPSLTELIAYAQASGLSLSAYEVLDPRELYDFKEYPILVLLREGGRLHMAYLSRRKGKRFLLLDPAKGKRWLKGEELLELWDGRYLVIENYEEKGEPPLLWRPPMPTSTAWALIAFALLPMVLMMAALGLMGQPSLPFALALSIAGLSVVSSLGQKLFLLGAMRRFDQRYMSGVDAKFLKKRRDLYLHYHAYKRAAFVSRSEVYGRFATVLCSVLFFLFHDGLLAMGCAISVALAVGVHLLCAPRLLSLAAHCESMEGNYFYALADEEKRAAMREDLGRSSNSYGLTLSLSHSLLIVTALSAAAFAVFLQGVFSPQIALFYGVACLYVSNETEQLFQSHTLWEQKKKEEPYFMLNIASRVL